MSIAVFAVTSVVAGVVIVRLPANYFTDEAQRRREADGRRPGRMAWRIAKNALGWLLIVAGVAMLALPGPGLLVLLMGVMLADFPGKRGLQRWIISRRSVFKTSNAVRRRFGRPPLEAPDGGRSRENIRAELDAAT